MRVVSLTNGWTVILDCVVWAIGGTAIGYGMHRRPITALAHDSVLTRLRPFEADGRWYEQRLRIKRWKTLLPEAGAAFRGGFSKRRLSGGSRADLERFVCETRRAELTHWFVLALSPFFVLWNPRWLFGVMVLYAIVANVPFLLIQRYNRARLLRALAAPRRRPRSSEPIDPP